MQRVFLVLTAVCCGCASSARNNGSGVEPLRLCVENATAGYGDLMVQANSVRFNVRAGETLCKPIGISSAAVRLRAISTAGGLAGPLSFATTLDPLSTRCWTWRVTNNRASSTNLQPC